jgi:hypothetical protein
MRALVASSLALLALPLLAAPAAAEAPEPRRLVYVPLEPHQLTGGDGVTSKIIFLNRCVGDCIVTKAGANNAFRNESTIPRGTIGEQFRITEFAHGDEVWEQVMECVRDVYAPFDVMVTDEDPGNVPHHEAISAGLGREIGWPEAGGVGGGGPRCMPANNVISFSFLNGYRASDIDQMCLTIAQESAHSFGLPDHIFDCTDPMTYLTISPSARCPRAYFRNKLMPCGEFEEGVPSCSCGGSLVNTHVRLTAVFGKGTQPPPPTGSFLYPEPGATIGARPILQIAADDPRGVFRIEIYVNGWRWRTWDQRTNITPNFSWPTSYPIDFNAEPAVDLPPGVADIEARVYNDLGLPGAFDEPAYASVTVQATIGAPCSSADQCFAGQKCEAGKCYWDPPSRAFGESCEFAQQCIGPDTFDGLCESDGSQQICTRSCFGGVNDNCPDGYYCLETNPGENSGVCWPGSPDDGGGCCSAGDGRRGAPLAPLLLALAVGGVLVAGRRRRVR